MMLCNPTSYYPQKMDDRVFFQDNDLERTDVVNHYNKLISRGKYDEANDYINQQKGIYGLFPDYLNLIENRIYHLQEHLLNDPSKNNPFFFYDKKGYGIHIFTDTDEEEDLHEIKLFSPDDTEYFDTETLYVFDDADSPDNLKIYVNETEEQELVEIEPPVITETMIWI